jgi:hypothetical protein
MRNLLVIATLAIFCFASKRIEAKAKTSNIHNRARSLNYHERSSTGHVSSYHITPAVEKYRKRLAREHSELHEGSHFGQSSPYIQPLENGALQSQPCCVLVSLDLSCQKTLSSIEKWRPKPTTN